MVQDTFKYATRNLMARKSRSFLTVLSIFVGITTIFIFISFGYGLYTYVEEFSESAGVDKVILQAKGIGAPGLDDTFRLEERDKEELERTNGIIQAAGMYFTTAEITQDNIRKFIFAVGIEPEPEEQALTESFFNTDIERGRGLEKSDSGKVLLGYNYLLPDKIMPQPYDVGDRIEVNGVKYDVVGFYSSIGNPQDDSNVYFVEEDYLELFAEDDPAFAMIVAQVDDVSQIDSIIERAERNLRSLRDVEEGKEDFILQSFAALIEQYSNILNIIVGFIIFIALISVAVSAVNTANTMVTSVLERVPEIGIMKSIGATNATIRSIFLIESALLGTIAGVIGVLVGWLIAGLGGVILTQLGWSFLAPKFPWFLFVGCIAFASLVGTVSGVFPAIQASRQSPVDALRYE